MKENQKLFISQFAKYFSSYLQAKDEFQMHKLDKSIQEFITDRKNQLLNISFFIIPRCKIRLGEYSFDEKGFAYNRTDLLFNRKGSSNE